MDETKICKKCGRILPIDNFRLVKGQFYNPYYLGQCRECEAKYFKEHTAQKNKVTFNEDLEIVIQREYKEINPARILDISDMNIVPMGTDEIFVKLVDYKNTWLSNYGRVIRYSGGTYNLLQGSCDNYGALRYSVSRNVFVGGKWKYKHTLLYAAKAVVNTFIVNPDKRLNIFIWHSGHNKEDNYYKNLYPLNQEQYRVVRMEHMKSGDVSEDFILKTMNDIRFMPEDWSKSYLTPIMCGIGYRGTDDVDCKSDAYIKWHDMMNRCYNEKFLERQPQYRGCTVCKEWHNFQNFKLWYEEHKYGNMVLDLDKDILIKGNKVYSPDTCCLVPHDINTLFITCGKSRGDLPLGVHFDKSKGKYRAETTIMGKKRKLGTFDNPEDAFARYKEFKTDLIETTADSYKGDLPDKVYYAMLDWQIEITD